MSWVSWVPGVHLARQAWDATKLGLEIRRRRGEERALILSQKNQVGKTFRRKEATRTFSNSVEMELASLLLYLVRTDETVYLHHLVQSSYKEAAVLLVSARRIRQVCLHASLDFQLPYRVYGATPPTL